MPEVQEVDLTTNLDPDPNKPFTGEMAILGPGGDKKERWDKHNADEVASARETFEKLQKKGYAAFRVEKNGDAGEKMKKFDPDAEAMILVPPIVGG